MRYSGKHVILYMHGNSGSRAGEHRKELYLALQNQDYHVVAFGGNKFNIIYHAFLSFFTTKLSDYRGYADSKQIPPSETSTVQDGLFVYKWIRSVLGSTSNGVHIFVWGHSLGTG